MGPRTLKLRAGSAQNEAMMGRTRVNEPISREPIGAFYVEPAGGIIMHLRLKRRASARHYNDQTISIVAVESYRSQALISRVSGT